MGYARKSQISLQETPYYHCVGRCVRRAWLWGVDEYSGKDYSHRKTWVIDRLRTLSDLFAIDVCAYAVMSNHYHTVVYVDTARALAWSDSDIISRWTQLFKLPYLVHRYQQHDASEAEQAEAKRLIESWRARLMDVSWFMRCLNEYLARRANLEDRCTGRFWEGRFKSQALLDEAGLLTAMAYVDLNPIRAGIAKTLETSEFTSIYERIRLMQGRRAVGTRLRPFQSERSKKASLPITLNDYLTLVEWSGQQIRSGKRGCIDNLLPPVLVRLHIDPAAWVIAMRPHGNVFGRALGKLNRLKIHARALGQAWVRGLKEAERLYHSRN